MLRGVGGSEDGVNAGIAGDMDFATDLLGAEVGVAEVGRREQQVGPSIDGDAKLLLRPRQLWIVGAEASLDMRQRHPQRVGGQRPTEGAGSVTLDDEEIGAIKQLIGQARGYAGRESARIVLAGASQIHSFKPVKAMGSEVQRRMLPGHEQARRYPLRFQGMGDGRKFDGFGTGADDQPYVGKTQSSP